MSGSIEFNVTGSMAETVGFQGNGSFAVDEESVLSLNGVCLGEYDHDARGAVANCDHIFARR